MTAQHPHAKPAPWQHGLTTMVVRDDARHKLCGFPPGQLNHGNLLGLGLTMYLSGAAILSEAQLNALLVEWKLERDAQLPELIEFGVYIHDAMHRIKGRFNERVMAGLHHLEEDEGSGKGAGGVGNMAREVRDQVNTATTGLMQMLKESGELERTLLDKVRKGEAISEKDNGEIESVLKRGEATFRMASDTMSKVSTLSLEMDKRVKAFLAEAHEAVRNRPECLLVLGAQS